MSATFWPTYLVILLSIALLFYDVVYRNWIDFPSHGILSLIAVFLVFLASLILGDAITGFLLLVPLIGIVVYIIMEAVKEKPTLEVPAAAAAAPAPSTCIDPSKIQGCKKLVQVLVSKEDSAMARCKAKQTAPPAPPPPPPKERAADLSSCPPKV
jgi:hypothetical protein